MSSNSSVIKDEDNNYPDWIELYNPTDTNINLNLYSLSDDVSDKAKWLFPNINLVAKGYLLIFASGKDRKSGTLHTNFKIKSSGEHLWLRDSNGQLLDKVDSVNIPSNISFGRNINNLSEWLFYESSTPGAPNTTIGYSSFSASPQFSLDGGFYSGSQQISFSNTQNIYYTLDGSEPQISSNLFSTPIIIDTTTVIRARRIQQNYLPSRIITQTFIIDENSSLPVISLATNPDNLWDDEIGIYTVGTNGKVGDCGDTANYNQDWERPVHIEFYETNGNLGFSIDAGIKIHGGCTRTYEQKSLKIIARRRYGFSTIPYKLFSKQKYKKYPSLILRSSGNDNRLTLIRDALMQGLVSKFELGTQAYRPSIVFLNGKYWGIHNIRERINKDFLEYHYQIDPNNIDFLRYKGNVLDGNAKHYKMMLNFFENNDIRNDSNYSYISTLMNIDNYVSYLISEMYFANRDWFPYNTKYWRTKNNGQWRWILYDTDGGFGSKRSGGVEINMFERIKDPNRFSSIIFRKLLTNDSFKENFISIFLQYSNTIFLPQKVTFAIDQLQNGIANEMPNHLRKWKAISSYNKWLSNIEDLRYFANHRLEFMRQHLMDEFQLDSVVTLNLDVSNNNAGTIHVNTFDVTNFPWAGKYFSNIPVKLTAKSKSGFKFLYWKENDSIVTQNTNLELDVSSNKIFTAVFKKLDDFSENVVINEINYDSSPDFDTEDWIELYNNTENDIDLSGWVLRDKKDKDKFAFSTNVILRAKDYLVVCRDTSAFINMFNKQANYGVENYIGNFEFGLSSKGEMIRLTNVSEEMIDSLKYDDVSPWPTSPKGNGTTLELKNPQLDNTIAANWGSSSNHGTPGKKNDSYIVVGVCKNKKSIPLDYILEQNYPNPFNPITTIQFGLPKRTKVKLDIYSILGKQLKNLIDKELAPGFYKIQFNGTNFSSGVYLYRITAEKFQQTRKLLLIK